MWLLYALLAAIVFGLRGVLYQWSSKQSMNRNLMLFGVFFTGVILCSIIAWLTNSQWTNGSLIGIVMGLFSFTASAAMYRGYAVGKASLIAILTAMPPIVVILLAFLLWGEKLSALQSLAFAIILVGILMIRYSSDLSFKQLKGVGWGLICMLFFGLNDTAGKQATNLNSDHSLTLFFMFLTGSACFLILYLFERYRTAGSSPPASAERADAAAETRLWSKRKTIAWGMFVGTTNVAGMYMILQAFDGGVAGLVSAVVALNVLIVLFYSRFFLKEKFKPLEIAGMTFAVCGILFLRLFS